MGYSPWGHKESDTACILQIEIPSDARSQDLVLVLMASVLASGFQEGFCPTDRFQERTHFFARLIGRGACSMGGIVPNPTGKVLGRMAESCLSCMLCLPTQLLVLSKCSVNNRNIHWVLIMC